MKMLLELYSFAAAEEITVDFFKLKKRQALSHVDDEGNCFIAIDPQKLNGLADEKMKLSHELGHCATGSFYNRFAACDVRKKHEIRADKWAIEQLVPEDALDHAVASGYIEIWSLAEYFDVTETFMRKAVCWYTY